jgi:hypothetical protein
MASVDYAALDDLIRRVNELAHPDPRPLLTVWKDRIVTGNRDGILARTDGNGQPLRDAQYRPKPSARAWTAADQAEHLRTTHLRHRAPIAAGHGDGLSPAQYRQLSGPGLAPRGANSRVITHLATEQGYDTANQVYFVSANWFDVVSSTGVQFLLAHFTGAATGRNHATILPVRDLRGIRPWTQTAMLGDVTRWGETLVQVTFA